MGSPPDAVTWSHTGLFAGTSFTLNRFTGPDRFGIQRMTYHQPIVANAGQRSTGIFLGGLVGDALEGFR